MRIAELLNEPAPRKQAEKRLDMASLDLFTQKRQHRPELSMSRIIQELNQSDEASVPKTRTFAAEKETPVVNLDDFKETKTSRRRTRSGFAPLTESQKRVKQRMLVKRSYYRKIDTLVGLRNEMEMLESKCREVIISRREMQLPASPKELGDEEQRCQELRERYTKLAITQDDLRHENEQLRAEAMDESKARTRVGILLTEELQDQKEVHTKGKTLGLSLSPLNAPTIAPDPSEKKQDKPNFVLDFKPLTEDECITIVREAYGDVRAFVDKENHKTTGASVFGWRDRRQVDGETMRFFLEKTFKDYTAAEISSRIWDFVSSEHGVNRLYASDVAINFHLVQRVNDENVLFYRTIEPIGVNMVLKALVLASRVQIDDNGSFMVLFRSIDPRTRGIAKQEISDTGFSPVKKEVWSDVFSWGLYEAVGDCGQHCRNYFGGFVSSLVTQRSLEFWLMHILLIAVRCENEVIRQLFIMQ